MFGGWSCLYFSHIPSLVELGGMGGLPQLFKRSMSVLGCLSPYAALWIFGPLSLKLPYLGLEAIFFRSRKFCWFFEHRSNFWELFGHLAAKLGVLLVVRVEAISESLDLAVKSGGRETKKARVAPTTSQCRRKLKLGISTHHAKSPGKTVRRACPKISWTLFYSHIWPETLWDINQGDISA